MFSQAMGNGFFKQAFGGRAAAGTLLMDAYSGISAIYSFRKLRSVYEGPAVRMRRSSDNAEQDIGFLNNEFDTAAASTFLGGSSGFIVRWYDQSGNGNHAVQVTTGQQPSYTASAVNGKPAMLFDGSNDNLAAPDSNSLDCTAVSAFLCWDRDSGGTASIISKRVTGSVATNYSYYNQFNQWNGSAYTGPTLTVNVWTQGTFTQSSTQFNAWRNGTLQGSSPYSNGVGSVNGGNLWIGISRNSFEPLTGSITEIIIMNSVVDSTTRTTIESSQRTYIGT